MFEALAFSPPLQLWTVVNTEELKRSKMMSNYLVVTPTGSMRIGSAFPLFTSLSNALLYASSVSPKKIFEPYLITGAGELKKNAVLRSSTLHEIRSNQQVHRNQR